MLAVGTGALVGGLGSEELFYVLCKVLVDGEKGLRSYDASDNQRFAGERWNVRLTVRIVNDLLESIDKEVARSYIA